MSTFPKDSQVGTVLALGDAMGGKAGRQLSALAQSIGSAPELGVRTGSIVNSQIPHMLSHIGRYAPGVVPIQIKKRMRKDAQISFALAAAKSPILAAKMWFESKSTETVALLNEIFLTSGFLRQALETSLLAIEFGFSAHEKVWDVEESVSVSWDVPMGGKVENRTKNYPSLFVPKECKELDPEKVTLLQSPDGSLAGLYFGPVLPVEDLKQILASKKDNVVPREKMFHFALGDEWQNPYGTGALDAAYDPWFWQQVIYLICNRWFERKSDPPLIGYAPTNPVLGAPENDGDTYSDADETDSPLILHARGLNKLRSTGTYVMPSEPWMDENNKPSTVRAYEVKEMEVADMSDVFLSYIDHLDRKKCRAILVPDSIVSSTKGTGTYGSLQVLADIAVELQNARLNRFVRAVNQEWIQPFLKYNGIKEKVLLRTSGISSSNKDILKDIAGKILEADMLAEQAWGRIFPNSMTSIISRDDLLRGLGIPYKQPDPDAPAPTPPPAATEPGVTPGVKPPNRTAL